MISNNNYKYKVSVGFPVYNVENYVKKSLTSVLDQDFDDFEILVIDDCGNDNSMSIIQELVNTHHNGDKVNIIKHEVNKGLAEARNTAIKNAKGKYIYFIDSDDYITVNTLYTLYEAAEKFQADVVYGSSSKQKGDIIYEEQDNILPYKLLLLPNEFSDYLYNNIKDVIPVVAWNILFSMDFLSTNNLFFPNIRFQEDLAFDEIYQPYVQKAVLLPDKTYFYLIREDSLMNKQARKIIDISEAYRAINLCNILKESCNKWEKTNYYGGKCAKVMKKCFFQAAGILKHRDKFSSPISDREIRNIMKHPASFTSILRNKQLRKYNLFYYALGILPSKISIEIIQYICRKKGYLKLSKQL